MTKNEARSRIEDIFIDGFCDNCDAEPDMYDCTRVCAPLDLLVEALDTLCSEPSGDLISRADAIEAVMAEGRKVYTSEYANAERVIYEADAVEALSMLPSADAVQGWIPCSERLPADKTYVLTTIQVNGRQPHVRSGFYHGGFFHNDNGETWRATEKPLKAWMPLPKPYKGGGSE